MKNTFLMLYSVLGLLGAKGGRWDVEMEGPNVGKSPEGGSVCSLRSHIWGDFWQTEYAECMDNMFLMFYQVLGSLGAKGATRGAEIQGNYLGKPPENR